MEHKDNVNKNIIKFHISICKDKVPIPQNFFKLNSRFLTSVDYTKQPSNTPFP